MEKKRLSVWLGQDPDAGPAAPRPTAATALYREPNRDRTRKNCGNCVLFLKKQGQCAIHDSGVPVGPDMVCGFHVNGRPEQQIDRGNMQAVSPKNSGLKKAPRGVSCDRCMFYTSEGTTEGACRALEVGGESMKVHALGYCTFWAAKTKPA